MKKMISILALILLTSSCSTIHYRFDNEPNGQGVKEWTHYAIYELVEYSDPVRIKNHCNDGVHKITSRKNPVQAILTIIPYLKIFWSAREVKMECSDKSIASNSNSGQPSNSGNGNDGGNVNNNNININITPDMLKQKSN